ncbi:unnamed protein product [Prorocentrum cordatum]|uniref:Impact N-terminal domain-containing protein n=1 Tax=Prorocentrum cordatum TaxID=2364126 RepID=A0ABN9VRL6_9DINO|nr:unnamed protein product [Polarella glacialis]
MLKVSFAQASQAGGLASGGLLARSRLEHGLARMKGYETPVVRPGRAQLLHHAGLTPGRVVVGNVYLESGAGVGAFNYEALRDLACRLKQHGRPCVIGGDFNCTKAELEKSGVLRFPGGTCVDTLEPICAQSMRPIDMFIVSRGLRLLNVEVISGSPVWPHRPVVLELEATRQRPYIRVMDVPKSFPQQRPAGCARWDYRVPWVSVGAEVRRLLRSAPRQGHGSRAARADGQLTQLRDQVNIAWQRFLEQAETDWIDIYQVGEGAQKYRGRGQPAQPRWVRKLPVAGARWPNVSVEATWLYRVSCELQLLAAVAQPVSRVRALQGLHRLMVTAPKAVKAVAEAEPHDLPVASAWWQLLNSLGAHCLDPSTTVLQLSECARVAAVKLAERDMSERKVRFQQWIAKQASGGGGGPHAVARLPIGFAESPMLRASTEETHAVFCEPADLAAEATALEVAWGSWWRTSCEQVALRWPKEVAEAAFKLKTLLTEVDLNVALSKSRVLANVPDVRRAVAAKLKRPLGMMSVKGERNLGVDFSCGRRVVRKVRGDKMVLAGLGTRRVALLKTGAGRKLAVRKVARSGLEAPVSNGFSVTGCAATELDKLRTLIFTAVAPSVAGRSRAEHRSDLGCLLATLELEPAKASRLHGKATRLAPKECGYLASVIVDGQWPQRRKYLNGYAAGDKCLLCGDVGTLLHRHTCCSGWPPELRLPSKIRELASKAVLEEVECMLERVLWPAPRGIIKPPRPPGISWLGQDVGGVLPPGDVYLDGSAYGSDFQQCTSVGWAAVVLQEGADAFRTGISGMLCEPFADINGGELAALSGTLRHAVPPVRAIVDSNFVFKGVMEHGPLNTTRWGHAWAHLWRELWRLVEHFGGIGPQGLTLKRVPAHVPSRRVVDDGIITARDWIGNRIADQAAKRAAERARVAPEARQRLQSARELVEGVAMWVSAVGAAVGGDDTAHRAAKPNKAAPRAALQPAAARLGCDLRGPPGARWCSRCRWLERASECPGSIATSALDHNRKLRAQGALAHVIAKIEPQIESQLQREMPLLACLVCGATGAARSSSFARACGEPGAKGKLAIARLAKGFAPGAAGRVAIKIVQVGDHGFEDGDSVDDGDERRRLQELRDRQLAHDLAHSERSRALQAAGAEAATEAQDEQKWGRFDFSGAGIATGEPVTDRKSTFIAFLWPVSSREEVDHGVAILKANGKIARAAHNMLAWRLLSPATGTLVSECDSDGEGGAGGGLHALLHNTGAQNVAVLVSRWCPPRAPIWWA